MAEVLYYILIVNTKLIKLIIYHIVTRAGLRGGANRAIARGPTFLGAHELFENILFTIYQKKNFLTVFFLYIINSN